MNTNMKPLITAFAILALVSCQDKKLEWQGKQPVVDTVNIQDMPIDIQEADTTMEMWIVKTPKSKSKVHYLATEEDIKTLNKRMDSLARIIKAMPIESDTQTFNN